MPVKGVDQEPTGGEPRDSIQLPCAPPASGKEDVIIQDEVFGPAEETPPNFSKVFDQNHCNKKVEFYNFAIFGYSE